MAFSFKYKQSSFPDGTTVSVPKIPVSLVGEARVLKTMCLLDSGATETMVPKEIADLLGLEMKKSNKTTVTAVGGKTEAWQSKIKIIVEEKGRRKHHITASTCILNDNDLDEIVVGRAGFFEAFDITFMETRKRVRLKPVG